MEWVLVVFVQERSVSYSVHKIMETVTLAEFSTSILQHSAHVAGLLLNSLAPVNPCLQVVFVLYSVHPLLSVSSSCTRVSF